MECLWLEPEAAERYSQTNPLLSVDTPLKYIDPIVKHILNGSMHQIFVCGVNTTASVTR